MMNRFTRFCLLAAVCLGSYGYCQDEPANDKATNNPTANPTANVAADSVTADDSPGQAKALAGKAPYTTTVGMPARLVDLILPGGELEVIPIERDAPVVVRLLQTIKHGTDAYRYELEYYCLEPGEYNLANYLQLTNGEKAELPEVNVTVAAKLGEGQVLPNAVTSKSTPRVGGYTMWLFIAGVIWFAGLLALLFAGKTKEEIAEAEDKRVSLADRMKPLVEQAMKGDLPGPKQAELERMLLTYWRGKLDLNKTEASQAIVELRKHETAGQLLRQLENWLHMPADRRTEVDVAELLKPYKNVRDAQPATTPREVAK